MRLTWDTTGDRRYETGVNQGVLYIPDNQGVYNNGYPWNGLVTVTESPSGAESNPQYADNIKYLNLKSAEEFGATIEAFTYPDEFAQCDGTADVNGVMVGQQSRKSFGLSYQTLVGNDTEGSDYGRKLHLIYGADAAPSERAYTTVNDSPEAITFSWELTTTATAVGEINGVDYKPTAILTIDSTRVSAAAFKALEDVLYGTASQEPRLPMPAEVIAMFDDNLTPVTPTAPSYNSTTKEITVPTQTGVKYQIDNADVTGVVTITEDTTVKAVPDSGFKFPGGATATWTYTF